MIYSCRYRPVRVALEKLIGSNVISSFGVRYFSYGLHSSYKNSLICIIQRATKLGMKKANPAVNALNLLAMPFAHLDHNG